jgi:uncharacterized protein (DUF2267 family)
MELQYASRDFESFLADVKEVSGLATRNQAYTTVQGVFQVFRRRLDLKDAIRFANGFLRCWRQFSFPIGTPTSPSFRFSIARG